MKNIIQSNKKTHLNIIANILGKIWSMLAIFIFMPLYIKCLGEEQYGIISFFITFQTFLLLMNGGFNTSLKREFSVRNSEDGDNRKYKLMRSTELLFAVVSIIIIAFCVLSSDFIANKWLNIGSLDVQYVRNSIILMGAAIALQIYLSLYTGCLQGLEHQVAANATQSLFYLYRNLGALLVIQYIRADVRLFFICYIVAELINIIINRLLIIRWLECKKEWSVHDLLILKTILIYTLGVFSVSVISIINAQLDKVFISKYMQLSDMTYYSVAASIGQAPLLVINAIAVAVFPQIVQSVSQHIDEKALYEKYSTTFAILAIPIASCMSCCMLELIKIWQNNNEIALNSYIAAILLTIANTFYSMQVTADNFLLATKDTKSLNIKSLISMCFSALLMILLIPRYGLLGASFSYMVIAAGNWFIYGGYAHKKFTESSFFKWQIKGAVLPIIFCLVTALLTMFLADSLKMPLYLKVISLILCGILQLLIFVRVYIPDVYRKLRIRCQ